MAIKVNDILNYIRTQLAALDNLVLERIKIGPIDPGMLGGDPMVSIVMGNQPHERGDGTDIRREMKLDVGVIMRIDPLSATDPDLQLSAIYEPIHAKLETMRDGVEDQFLMMVEDGQGPGYESVYGKDVAIRLVSCGWTVTFDRTLGATE